MHRRLRSNVAGITLSGAMQRLPGAPARWALLLGATLGVAPGCTDAAEHAEESMVVASVEPVQNESRAEQVERMYLVGPAAARRMGYRIGWQVQTSPVGSSGIRRITVSGDSVFVLDGQNFLTRLRASSGDRLWKIPVASPLDDILGITFVEPENRVLITLGGEVLVLDAITGSQVQKQQLDRIANTMPLLDGQFLIYGARNGQLCWHSYAVDSLWRSYQIANSVKVAPIYSDGYVVAVGTGGRVMVLDAGAATRVWSRELLDEVTAQPTAGNGTLFVAGRDHYVWAFDLNQNRAPLWRYLTETPLTDAPVLIDDRLYQQIPSEGLVCFNAFPLDAPGGEVLWSEAKTTGSVLVRRRNTLLAWDRQAHSLSVLDRGRGATSVAIDLPDADHLQASKLIDGDLYGASHDGRVIRLVPRN